MARTDPGDLSSPSVKKGDPDMKTDPPDGDESFLSQDSILPGVLAGRYDPIRDLGVGGMGVVLLARDRSLNREVAIKLLQVSSPSYLQRFRREAKIQASLEHENIVRLYDYGVIDQDPYLVMEFVRGGSLKDRLDKGARIPLDLCIDLLLDILRGLKLAHDRGIIHRDLKPANVFLDSSGHARIADFGLATEIDTSKSDFLTRTGAVLGTPYFMAPEQHRGHLADASADIYAFGVTMYMMLTGRPPFRESDMIQLTLDKEAGPPPVTQADPSIPEIISRLVTDTLSREPGSRPTAATCYQVLEEWLRRSRAGDAMRTPPSSSSTSSTESLPIGRMSPVSAKYRLGVSGLLALLGLGILGVHESRDRRDPDSAPSALATNPGLPLIHSPIAPLASPILPSPLATTTPVGRVPSVEDEPSSTPGELATLKLITKPPGATVFLDGERQRTTTPTSFSLSAGKHTLLLEKEGFQSHEEPLSALPRDSISVTIPLLPGHPMSGLRVLSDPPNSYVILDGKTERERTPMLLPMSPGIYSLVVRHPGYSDFEKTVILSKRHPADVRVTLSKN